MAEITQKPDRSELGRTILKWAINSYRFYETWRQDAILNYAYVDNRQWQNQVDLDLLRRQKRPPLTVQKILPQINALGGMQRANRLDIKALPLGSSDVGLADLMSGLIKYVEVRSNGDYEQSQIFDDGLITGMGVGELAISFDDDFDGEILFRRIDPLQVFPDPESRRADWDDARYVMKAPFKDPEELVLMLPEHSERIRSMSRLMKSGDWLSVGAAGADRILTGDTIAEAGNAFVDAHTGKLRVLQCYYRVARTLWVVVQPDGVTMPIEQGQEMAEAIAAEMGGRAERRKVKVVRVATVLGWEVLEDVPSPFPTRHFPLVPYMPMLWRNMPRGLVYYLRPLQDEVNKRRSQILHHINCTANSGWLNKAHGGADPKVLEMFGSTPGIVITYSDTPPERIQPFSMPSGLSIYEQMTMRDLTELGANPEIMGQGSQRFISGKAMQTRQVGGVVTTTRYFDQLRLTRKLLGNLLVSIIPQLYTPQRIRQILDAETANRPEGEMAQLAQQLAPAEDGADPVARLVERASELRFDIVVDDAPALPTHRQAQFQQMIQLAALFPGLVSPEDVVEYADFPNRDVLISRMMGRLQQMQEAGGSLAGVVGQGRGNPGISELLDSGDLGAQAQANAGAGQEGAGGA